jgi:hypothetical protein
MRREEEEVRARVSSTPVSVRFEEGWLLLEAPLPEVAGRLSAWELLATNARLPGLTRVALGADGQPVLRADLPDGWDPGEESGSRTALARSSADFDKAWSLLAYRISDEGSSDPSHDGGVRLTTSRPEGGDSDSDSDPETNGEEARGDGEEENAGERLAALCRETGWTFSERASRVLMVNLEVPGQEFYQAAFIDHRERGVRAVVDLAAWRDPTGWVGQGLGRLLLAAGRVVRLARPAVCARTEAEEDGTVRLCFEVWLESPPSPSQLDHAFLSLSSAARICGREAEAFIRDETLARAYLAAQTQGRLADASIHKAQTSREINHAIA